MSKIIWRNVFIFFLVFYFINSNVIWGQTPGIEKWRFTAGGAVDSSPAIGSDDTVYFGSDDNNLYAIAPDGIEQWRFLTGGEIKSSPAIASDGTIYVGSNDGYFYAINSDSRGLAISLWPKFSHDNKNTGRSGAYVVPLSIVIVFISLVLINLSTSDQSSVA